MAVRVRAPRVAPVGSAENVQPAPYPWGPAIALGIVGLVFLACLAEIGLRIADLRATNMAALQCVGSATSLQTQYGLYVLDSNAGYVMLSQ